jgi:hypothetical protein
VKRAELLERVKQAVHMVMRMQSLIRTVRKVFECSPGLDESPVASTSVVRWGPDEAMWEFHATGRGGNDL